MKNIIHIIKKEFSRFFKDKRMVITTLILPGLMIYFLYSIMGGGMSATTLPEKNYEYKVYVYNESQALKSTMDSISETLKTDGIDFLVKYTIDPADTIISDAFNLIKEKKIDLVIVYPPKFDSKLSDTNQGTNNIIKMYYNSTNKNSSTAYDYFYSYYHAIEQGIANVFDINTPQDDEVFDLATKEEVSAQIFSMLLPMLLIMFLFSGCISIASESIAGEKERGTIATLLVTPINRRDLAIGKIISLSLISLLSGLSSFLGTMLSLPNMMGEDMALKSNVYAFSDYMWLLLIILSSVLLFTAIIGIISAYSKSVKEATSLMTPILICVTLLGMTSMFTNGATTNTLSYLIPIYNSVHIMTAIFSFSLSPMNVLITVGINAVYTCLLVVLLAKMFNSEKIMFNK